MTHTILLPGWESLAPEEKKSAEELIKSILSGRKASAALLKLLKGEQANGEFIEKLEKILKQPDDFKITESATTQEKAIALHLVPLSCESVCGNDPQCLAACHHIFNVTPVNDVSTNS